MLASTTPNYMVIGQLVYDSLEDNQKSDFQQLDIFQKYGVMLTTIRREYS
ncbi:hypothetical protein BH18THE2_BH18THE2_41590 [soil metagenome]